MFNWRKIVLMIARNLVPMLSACVPLVAGINSPKELSLHDTLVVRQFSHAVLSADGNWLAYSARTSEQAEGYDFDREEARTGVPFEGKGAQIYVTDVDTGKTACITQDIGSNWLPSWSPNGLYLAFFSDREGGRQAKLWVWDRLKNELRKMSDFSARGGWQLREGQIEWGPDNRRILFGVLPDGVSPEHYVQQPLTPIHNPDVATPEPRSTISLYKAGEAQTDPHSDPWNLNWARRDLAVADVTTGESTIVVRGKKVATYRLSPSGQSLAYTIPLRFERAGSQQIMFDLVSLDLDGSVARTVARDVRLDYNGSQFSWSPNGRYLTFRSSGVNENKYDCFVVSAPGAIPVNVTNFVDVSNFWDNDSIPLWSLKGDGLYFLKSGDLWHASATGDVPNRVAHIPGRRIVSLTADPSGSFLWDTGDGRTTVVLTHDDSHKQDGIYKIDVNNGKPSLVVERNQCYTCSSVTLAASRNGGRLIFSSEDAQHSSDIWLIDHSLTNTRRLTALNPQFDTYTFGAPRLISWLSDDGETLQGTLLLPADYQEGERYPLVTFVYGGAMLSDEFARFGGQFGAPFNMQLLATRGYAVLLPDAPLGQGSPMLDLVKTVLPGVNKVVEMGIGDPTRLGVMGHSNGGYSTLALITQTRRFRAAIDIAGVGDLLASYGEMDSDGVAFGTSLTESDQAGGLGGTPWKARNSYVENSPAFYFDRVKTPVLIVQGDADSTVAPFLSDQVFVMLRRLGKVVEYVKYKAENHAPSAWSYEHQEDFCGRMIEWFRAYLKPLEKPLGSSLPR